MTSTLKLVILLPTFAATLTPAQTAPANDGGCNKLGYRVVSRRWDIALNRTWEMRQDCGHPAWPARSVAVEGSAQMIATADLPAKLSTALPQQVPLMIQAGETVRLWSQEANVRIELSGTADRSARLGEKIQVRVMNRTESGVTTQQIAGIVRGPKDVEMQR